MNADVNRNMKSNQDSLLGTHSLKGQIPYTSRLSTAAVITNDNLGLTSEIAKLRFTKPVGGNTLVI